MNRRFLDTSHSMALGERTRREMLRLLSGAGVGLASLTPFIDAAAVSDTAQPGRAHRTKKFKGDPRCKHRKTLSLHGVCIGSTPGTTFPAQCAPTCFCVADHRRSARTCVQVGCEGSCASDADCLKGSFCANTAGCCLDHPEYERTCVTPCPVA